MNSATSPSESAGQLLRTWRNERGVSQLNLALEADVSARHISFVENGRANPSREMIVTLSEALDIPLRERNRILTAAGFSSQYRETPLGDPSMDSVKRALDVILENHHPAGAVAVDWSWNVLQANRSMMITAAQFCDPALLQQAPLNLMRLTFHPDGLYRSIENWDEVGPILVSRIRRDADYEGRPEIRELLDELLASPAVRSEWTREEWTGTNGARGDSDLADSLLIPLHLKNSEIELRLFSTITTLGTPQDITLQELRIESFYPMDDASSATLRALCGDA